MDNNLGFHKFSFIFLCDWSRQIVPLSQPIRCKARTDHHLGTVVFLHFRQYCCFYFDFSLAPWDIFLKCDWPLCLCRFWFTPLTTQMLSLQNSYNTTSHVRSLRIFQFLFKLCFLLNSLFLNTFLSFVSFKKPYLVSSFIHISFGIHLNSSSWVPSLDKVFLRKLKTKQNKNNLWVWSLADKQVEKLPQTVLVKYLVFLNLRIVLGNLMVVPGIWRKIMVNISCESLNVTMYPYLPDIGKRLLAKKSELTFLPHYRLVIPQSEQLCSTDGLVWPPRSP